MINLKKFIRKITHLERRRREVSYTLTGEIVKLTLEELAKLKPSEIDKVLEKHERRD